MAFKGKKTTTTIVRKTYKKKGYSQKRKSRATVHPLTNVKMGKGFPQRLTMTHKYTDIAVLQGVAGAAATYLFSCNSLYDPNHTGAGHQPQSYDDLTSVYDHYTVIGAKCRWEIIPKAAAEEPLQVALWINDSTAIPSQSSLYQSEQSNKGMYFIIGPGAVDRTWIRTLKWSARKQYGKGLLANDQLRGTSTSSPTEQSYFAISVGAIDGSSTVDVYAAVVIEYIAVWTELKSRNAQ